MRPPDLEYDGIPDEALQTPAWLVRALRESVSPSDGFLAACERASATGLVLARLQRVSRRMELSLLAAPEYLRSLAAVACVPLEGIVAWAGIPADFRLDQAFAKGWGRLARALGLELREALLRLRLTFADEVGLELVPVRARAATVASDPNASNLSEVETFLAREALRWDSEVLDQMRSCERAVCDSYQTGLGGQDVDGW
jgi:hypothetical protein